MKGLCRACLGFADPPKPLFSEDGRQETPAYLVWKCTGVRPMEGDRLPESLCQKCFMQLSIANHFRLLVQKSNSLLLQCVHVTVELDSSLRIRLDTDVIVENNESEYCINFKNENTNVTAEDIESNYSIDSENVNNYTEMELADNMSDIDITEVKIKVENDFNDDFMNDESTGYGTNEEYPIVYDSNETDHMINDQPSDSEDASEKHANQHFENMNQKRTSVAEANRKIRDQPSNSEDAPKKHVKEPNKKNQRRISVKKSAIQKIVKGKPFKCDECDEYFLRQPMLMAHKVVHNTCIECDIKFDCKPSYDSHKTTFHPDERNTRTSCEKVVLNVQMAPFTCKLCNVTFISESEFTYHKYAQHSLEKYACHLCNFITNTQRCFGLHLKRHATEKEYVCHLCPYATHKKRFLSKHLETHNTEMNFKCNLCRFATNVKLNLTKHFTSHHKVKKYKCHLCEFKTNVKSTLNLHLIRHSGVRAFKCDLCEWTGYTQVEVRRHKVQHNKEKFTCPMCEKKFGYKYNLKVHMLNLHAVEFKWERINRRVIK